MKKVLSLLLALCMALSLCACDGEADAVLDEVKANNHAADNYHPGNTTVPEDADDETSDKVVVSSKWKVGKVDPSLLFTLEHMPLTEGDVRFKMTVESYGGISSDASFGFDLYFSDGVSTGFSMQGKSGEKSAEALYFDVDDQSYMFSSITIDGETDAGVYKIVGGEDELDDEIMDMSDGIDPAGITDVEGYKLCEYVGVEDGMDKFRVVDEDDMEMFFYLDIATQRLAKMTYTVEEDGETTALILYGDEAKLGCDAFDLDKAVEADSETVGMAFLAPMLILMSGVEIAE